MRSPTARTPARTAPTPRDSRGGTRFSLSSASSEVRALEFLLDVAGLADRPDVALDHDGSIIRHFQGYRRELLDHEDGHTVRGDPPDDRVQLLDDLRCETHRDLVQEEQPRLGGDGPGQREHLLLAARERSGELFTALLQRGEQVEHLLLDLAESH